MQSLISIIIPTYNRAHFIGETLESVIAQTYQNWECIVVDDGSTDYTREFMDFYLALDQRIFYYTRGQGYKRGGNGARNMGIEKSISNLIMFLDSDDVLIRDCLQRRIKFIKNSDSRKIDIYIFKTGTFFKKLGDNHILWNKLNSHESNLQLLIKFLKQDMPWHTNGVLWKKTFLVKIGKWNEKLVAWQDWELNVRSIFNRPHIAISEEIPDNFYRLNVVGSIASKKRELAYFNSIAIAIKSIESILTTDNQKSEIGANLKFLILRVFIHYPLKLGLYKIPFKIISQHKFKLISKLKFFQIYLLELFANLYPFKRFMRRIWKNYFKNIKPNTTFLKET